MLYNQSTGLDRNPCLDDLVSWLERKDQNREYVYNDYLHCLAAQYNNSLCRIYDGPYLTFFDAIVIFSLHQSVSSA